MAGEKYIEVGGRLHSIATGNVLAGANEIIDDEKEGKKQSIINAETDAALEDRYTKDQTYSKSELNNMITTPNQEYVSVTATAQTTAVTDVLPPTGEADTVYRVGNWDGSQFDPSVYSEYAWNGSQYVHLSTKTQIGEVFDISAYHATGGTLATYADLSAALDSNNGGGVPQSLQKGGMSVKFVQSSDNKYVQFRLTADAWSIYTEDWAIADEGVYVDNPEFIYVKTDKDDKILWGIKTDGSIYYGAGVPQQVKDYIEGKISSLSLDEYEDIVAFLSDYLDSDTTLKVMIDEINAVKVDKKEGKSLIDAEYAEGISQIENPEFIETKTDSEGKLLEARKVDGTKVEYCNLQVEGSIINKEIQHLQEKVSDAEETLSYFETIENSDWLSVTTDKDGKILNYRDKNGLLYEAGIKTEELTVYGEIKGDFMENIKKKIAFFSYPNSIKKISDNIILDSIISINNVLIINPSASGYYGAFWIRDWAYGLWGKFGFSANDILQALNLVISTIPTSGERQYWVPDHITNTGIPIWKAGSSSDPNAGWGKKCSQDGIGFLLMAADYYIEKSNDLQFIEDNIELFENILDSMLSNNYTYYQAVGEESVVYGFYDTVKLAGNIAFTTLQLYNSYLILKKWASLIEREENYPINQIKTAFNTIFVVNYTKQIINKHGISIPSDCAYIKAADEVSQQYDVWTSAMAVYSGILTQDNEDKVINSLIVEKDNYIKYGIAKHVPTNFYYANRQMWEAYWGEVPVPGNYQNGAYWHTPIAFIIKAIKKRDAILANNILKEALDSGINFNWPEYIREDGTAPTVTNEYVSSVTSIYKAIQEFYK